MVFVITVILSIKRLSHIGILIKGVAKLEKLVKKLRAKDQIMNLIVLLE